MTFNKQNQENLGTSYASRIPRKYGSEPSELGAWICRCEFILCYLVRSNCLRYVGLSLLKCRYSVSTGKCRQ